MFMTPEQIREWIAGMTEEQRREVLLANPDIARFLENRANVGDTVARVGGGAKVG